MKSMFNSHGLAVQRLHLPNANTFAVTFVRMQLARYIAIINPSSLIYFFIISTVLILFLLPYRLWTSTRKKTHKETLISLSASQALSVIFTPTCGAWPSHVASHFTGAQFSGLRCIELKIFDLWEQICAGTIELRNNKDLSELFQGNLRIYGLTIKLYVDRSCWLQTVKWTTCQYFSASQASKVNGHCSQFSCSHDLDFVAYSYIEQEIARIERIHQPGSAFMIEFSCIASRLGFLSDNAILCSIPFQVPFSRRHTFSIHRTSALLFVRLHLVIALLLKKSCVIEGIINVSQEHADSLLRKEQELANERKSRRQCINNEGVTRWREKRLMLAWEAGLLSAGLLIRWRVALKKNTRAERK